MKLALTIAILWFSARYVLRKCFAQLAAAAASNPRDNLLPNMKAVSYTHLAGKGSAQGKIYKAYR